MGREFTGESAFVDAYSEYFDAVYREALRYSGNHHVAEEIAQDGLCSARSSQIALAPALEITRSVRAKRSFSSSLIYSN